MYKNVLRSEVSNAGRDDLVLGTKRNNTFLYIYIHTFLTSLSDTNTPLCYQ